MVLRKGMCMLNGKRVRAGERRESRAYGQHVGGVSVETRPPARSLASSALGLDCGECGESGSLSCQKRGRAVARDKGGEWAAADASRDLLDGSGCTCERE